MRREESDRVNLLPPTTQHFLTTPILNREASHSGLWESTATLGGGGDPPHLLTKPTQRTLR